MFSDEEFNQAFESVEKIFPFKNYITQSAKITAFNVLRGISQLSGELQGKRLLDIGCGPMDKTGIFQKMGMQCHAVDDLNDPWHQRGDNAQKIKNYADYLNIVFYHQDLGDHNIPFPKESFDVVCALGVVEHLHESPRGLLNTMGSFARTEGLLVVVMPNSVNLRKRLSVLRGRTNYPTIDIFYNSVEAWRGHVREYTLQETNYICEQNGFKVLLSTTYEPRSEDKLKPPLRQLYNLLGKLIPTLLSGLLVICQKPDGWKPAIGDPDAYRKAVAKAVPKGVA